MSKKNIDSNSSTPLYLQLSEIIRDGIINGVYKVESQIPSEFELCKIYNVSRTTVRKSIDALAQEGLLIKIHGKGTFVAPPTVRKEKTTGIMGMTKNIEARGITITKSILGISIKSPDSSEAEFFNFTEKDPKLIALRRLHIIDGQPMCIETIYFTMEYLALLQEDFTGSFHSILREKFQIVPTSGYHLFEICFATKEEASILEIAYGASLLMVKDFVYDQNEAPLYISKRLHVGSGLKYAISRNETIIQE